MAKRYLAPSPQANSPRPRQRGTIVIARKLLDRLARRPMTKAAYRYVLGQVRWLLDKCDWGSGCRRIACGKVFVDLLSDRLELPLFELGEADATPAFGGTDQRRVHRLQEGALAEGMGDHLGAPPLLAKQPLQEIGGADRPAVAEREAQMRDAGLEIILEAGHRTRQITIIGRPEIVAKQPRQGRRPNGSA